MEEDDFKRIYDLKKQTQNQYKNKILELSKSNIYTNKDTIINNIIQKFETNFKLHKLDKNYLLYLVEKVEIDASKKIYIYTKFTEVRKVSNEMSNF